MAQNDILHVKVHSTMEAGKATVNFHVQEVTGSDRPGVNTQACAQAILDSPWMEAMRGLRANSANFTGVKVYNLTNPLIAPGLATGKKVGGRADPPLPSVDALAIGLVQSIFLSNRNGMVWINGISEPDCNGNTFTTSFMTTIVQPFIDEFANLITDTPQAGQWRWGVLSKKFIDDNPGNPISDAFAPVIGGSASPIVSGRSDRVSRKRGAPGAVV